jgi:hypothetical protein
MMHDQNYNNIVNVRLVETHQSTQAMTADSVMKFVNIKSRDPAVA